MSADDMMAAAIAQADRVRLQQRMLFQHRFGRFYKCRDCGRSSRAAHATCPWCFGVVFVTGYTEPPR